MRRGLSVFLIGALALIWSLQVTQAEENLSQWLHDFVLEKSALKRGSDSNTRVAKDTIKADEPRSSGWTGKRQQSFNPWGGKRSDGSFGLSEGAKEYILNRLAADGSFEPWAGKRQGSFEPWAGKRAGFEPWGGKRAAGFEPWGGKRAAGFEPWGGK